MGAAPIRVLFLCTGNSARSQMAEALLRKMGGQGFEVASAGVDPQGIHPLTYTVMADLGDDLASHSSKSLHDFDGGHHFDYVITLCSHAAEHCPATLARRGTLLHWPLDDPTAFSGTKLKQLAKFREVRDQLQGLIAAWVESVAVQSVAPANAEPGMSGC